MTAPNPNNNLISFVTIVKARYFAKDFQELPAKTKAHIQTVVEFIKKKVPDVTK